MNELQRESLDRYYQRAAARRARIIARRLERFEQKGDSDVSKQEEQAKS